MFECTCCAPPRSYLAAKALYKHQRFYDPNYVDPKDRLEKIERDTYASNPTKCLQCATAISFEERKTKLKFCSRSCSAKHNNKKRPLRRDERSCAHCGKIGLIKSSRRFCSMTCSSNDRRDKTIDGWLLNGATIDISTIRRYLRRVKGEHCWQCGWCEKHPVTGAVPVQVDHIDGNADNNTIENLRLLCPNCHSLTSTYGALNIGRGRDARRKRYKENR